MFGRTSDHPADQVAIANRAFANRIGNGDIASGDGWRFRGRGLKQLTGRANYRAFSRSHADLFGETIDFERYPDLLIGPKYAARSALFFWVKSEFYAIADRGVNESAANAITRIINEDTDSYGERWQFVKDFYRKRIFGNVCRLSAAHPRFEDR